MAYTHAMDREDQFAGIPINQIGTTSAPMRDQLEELKAKIRVGMSKVELGFWGAGKGSQQNPTPGTYGRDERSAIRELAKINDIELTTHSTPIGVAPLSGIDPQRGQYNDDARKSAMDEVRRAIEFAAEVTTGGAVVLHAGEYTRPIIDAGLDNSEKLSVREKDKPLFMEHEDAKNKGWFSTVDTRTGQVQQGPIPMGQTFRQPIIDGDGNVKLYDEDFVDGSGIKHFKGDPVLQEYTWKDLVSWSRDHNEKVKNNNVDDHFRKEELLQKFSNKEISPAELYQIKQAQDNLYRARGSRAYQQQIAEQNKRELDRLKELPESERNRAEVGQAIERLQENYNHFMEGIAQAEAQEAQIRESIQYTDTLENFALKKTASGLADLSLYAIEQQQKWEKERGEKLKHDLFISPENVFPEQYGGHPDELKKIIQEGRRALAEKLVQKKHFSESEAKKEAESRIKATFDIAHANLWKKYFTGSDEEYWDWYMKQLKDLQSSNVLGHIHVTDNFGYGDEHVSPGQGILPVKDIIERLKKSDVDFVVEPGWQGDRALIESFKEFGSPIYGISRPNTADPWNVIETSYFGRTAPPYFVVGEYGQQFGERVQRDFSSFAGVPFE